MSQHFTEAVIFIAVLMQHDVHPCWWSRWPLLKGNCVDNENSCQQHFSDKPIKHQTSSLIINSIHRDLNVLLMFKMSVDSNDSPGD